MKFCVALLMLAVPASARTYNFTKQVEMATLQKELIAAGLAVDSITCVKTACVIRMPDSEVGDPAPVIVAHVYDDPAVKLAIRRGQLLSLARKLRDNPGAVTEADRDNMLQLISYFILAQE